MVIKHGAGKGPMVAPTPQRLAVMANALPFRAMVLDPSLSVDSNDSSIMVRTHGSDLEEFRQLCGIGEGFRLRRCQNSDEVNGIVADPKSMVTLSLSSLLYGGTHLPIPELLAELCAWTQTLPCQWPLQAHRICAGMEALNELLGSTLPEPLGLRELLACYEFLQSEPSSQAKSRQPYLRCRSHNQLILGNSDSNRGYTQDVIVVEGDWLHRDDLTLPTRPGRVLSNKENKATVAASLRGLGDPNVRSIELALNWWGPDGTDAGARDAERLLLCSSPTSCKGNEFLWPPRTFCPVGYSRERWEKEKGFESTLPPKAIKEAEAEVEVVTVAKKATKPKPSGRAKAVVITSFAPASAGVMFETRPDGTVLHYREGADGTRSYIDQHGKPLLDVPPLSSRAPDTTGLFRLEDSSPEAPPTGPALGTSRTMVIRSDEEEEGEVVPAEVGDEVGEPEPEVVEKEVNEAVKEGAVEAEDEEVVEVAPADAKAKTLERLGGLAGQLRRERAARKAELAEAAKRKREEAKAPRDAKKARTGESDPREGTVTIPKPREPVVVDEGRAVSTAQAKGPTPSASGSSSGSGSPFPRMPIQTPEEVKAATGVRSIMEGHPSAGLLALAALQQQTVEADQRGRDLASAMASAMAMIPQAYLTMNQYVYQQGQLVRSWASKAEASAKQADDALKKAEGAQIRAERAEGLVESLEARRAEAAKASAEAEEREQAAVTALKEAEASLADKVKAAVEATEAGVAEKVKVAVQAAEAEMSAALELSTQKDFNSFYVDGWSEAAAFMRAGPDHPVWNIENILVPVPSAPIPEVVPLTPRALSEDEADDDDEGAA